jgi:hypothetical protein
MLPQLIALAAIARDKLAERDVVPKQKPLLAELDLFQRVSLINGMRRQHGGAPITEDDYLAHERRWVEYLDRHQLVRPRWMTNVN